MLPLAFWHVSCYPHPHFFAFKGWHPIPCTFPAVSHSIHAPVIPMLPPCIALFLSVSPSDWSEHRLSLQNTFITKFTTFFKKCFAVSGWKATWNLKLLLLHLPSLLCLPFNSLIGFLQLVGCAWDFGKIYEPEMCWGNTLSQQHKTSCLAGVFSRWIALTLFFNFKISMLMLLCLWYGQIVDLAGWDTDIA